MRRLGSHSSGALQEAKNMRVRRVSVEPGDRPALVQASLRWPSSKNPVWERGSLRISSTMAPPPLPRPRGERSSYLPLDRGASLGLQSLRLVSGESPQPALVGSHTFPHFVRAPAWGPSSRESYQSPLAGSLEQAAPDGSPSGVFHSSIAGLTVGRPARNVLRA